MDTSEMKEQSPEDEAPSGGKGARAVSALGSATDDSVTTAAPEKLTPCSSCQAQGKICKTSPKVPERRQRVLISSRYEKKIDNMEDRLAGIEESLRKLVSLGRHESRGSTSTPKSGDGDMEFDLQKTKATRAVLTAKSPEYEQQFEGDTSLAAHTKHAGDHLEKILRTRLMSQRSPRLDHAVVKLQQVMSSQSSPTATKDLTFNENNDPQARFHPCSAEMPPQEAVIRLIRRVSDKTGESYHFLENFQFINFDDFVSHCQSIYFAAADVDASVFVLVNCILSKLFRDIPVEDPAEQEDYVRWRKLCRANFEMCLDGFSLFVPASLETVQAMCLGANHGLETSKPLLSLRLIGVAAQMCQVLGYHRIPSPLTTPKARQKVLAFWNVYSMDMTMSLRYGRIPLLRDSDISTEIPEPQGAPAAQKWQRVYLDWIRMTRIQGATYQHLYSVAAMSKPTGERMPIVRQLAKELMQWHKSRFSKNSIPANATVIEYEEYAISRSVDVVYYSLLSTIYRCLPPDANGSFSKECVDAARSSLAAHQILEANVKFTNPNEWFGVMTWTLIYQPFLPFIVIFTQSITTLDASYLKIMSDFVSSLKTNETAPDSLRRFHALCSAFCDVAKVYVTEQLNAVTTAPPIMPSSSTLDPNLLSGVPWNPDLMMPEMSSISNVFGNSIEPWILGDAMFRLPTDDGEVHPASLNVTTHKMNEEKEERILVTGANGFIGAHVIRRLLQVGYSVRAAVRSDEKAQDVKRDQQVVTKALDFVVVPDMTVSGAYDSAFEPHAGEKKPITAVMHLASPITEKPTLGNEDEFLKPAIAGTKSILESAKKHGSSVKRVIITSSFAAVAGGWQGGPGHVFSEQDWSSVTYEQGVNGTMMQAYTAAKTAAERAAWDFMEKEKPDFDLTTLTPPYVYGPLAHAIESTEQLNTSSDRVYRLMKSKDAPALDIDDFHAWVDVRDLADAHLIALESPDAKGKRIFPTAGTTCSQEIADIIRKWDFPELKDRVKQGNPGVPYPTPAQAYGVDNSFSKKLGLQYFDLEQTLEDFVKQAILVEKQGKSQEDGLKAMMK